MHALTDGVQMGGLEMATVQTVKHTEYVDQLVQLFNSVFGQKMSPESWMWKHLANPLNGCEPSVIVAVDNGTIVGSRPLMRMNLRYRDAVLPAAVPCDAMVHPKYRRQGIFARMNQLAIEQENVRGTALFYNFPNRISGAGNIKQGWLEVSRLQDLILLTNPKRVAEAFCDIDWVAGAAKLAYGALFGRRGGGLTSRDNDVAVLTYNSYPESLSSIRSLYDANRLELDRTTEFMRWRLDDNPLEECRYLLAYVHGQLAGYMALAMSPRSHGLKQGFIVDCVVQDYDIRVFSSLVASSVRLLIDLGCDYIRAWGVQHPSFHRFLVSEAGFWAIPLPLLKLAVGDRLPRLVVRTLNSGLPESLDLLSPSCWNLTPIFGDPT